MKTAAPLKLVGRGAGHESDPGHLRGEDRGPVEASYNAATTSFGAIHLRGEDRGPVEATRHHPRVAELFAISAVKTAAPLKRHVRGAVDIGRAPISAVKTAAPLKPRRPGVDRPAEHAISAVKTAAPLKPHQQGQRDRALVRPSPR